MVALLSQYIRMLTDLASSNLLYPREDRQVSKLIYVCKACSSVQESEPACTYRAQLSSNVQETAGVVQNVANDPTVCIAQFPIYC